MDAETIKAILAAELPPEQEERLAVALAEAWTIAQAKKELHYRYAQAAAAHRQRPAQLDQERANLQARCQYPARNAQGLCLLCDERKGDSTAE